MMSRPYHHHHLLWAVVGPAGGVLVVLLLLAGAAAAHDVPDEVEFDVHVAPDGGLLHVPMRVPLVMLVDYPLPKRGPGYIDLADTERLESALGVVADDLGNDLVLFEGDTRLQPGVAGLRLSLPSDRSFDSYEEAVANITGPPLPDDTNLFWNQGYLDVYFTYAIQDQAATFSLLADVPPSLSERLHVLASFWGPGGSVRAYDLLGDMGRVELNPTRGFLIRLFSTEGLRQFLTSWENVLFVAAMAGALAYRPARSMRPLITFGVVGSLVVLTTGPVAGTDSLFTELVVSAAAAVSVLALAVGNVVARNMRHRWLTVAVCAVPQGLLLARGLEWILQFRRGGDVVPLAAYAGGALVGAVVVFVGALGVSWLLTRHPGVRARGPVVAALLIGYVGWHYTLERVRTLWQVPPPSLDSATVMGLARWGALLLLVVAGLWLGFEMVADRGRAGSRQGTGRSSSAKTVADPPTVVDQTLPADAGLTTADGRGNGRTYATINRRQGGRHETGDERA